jgi:hypothetical protein
MACHARAPFQPYTHLPFCPISTLFSADTAIRLGKELPPIAVKRQKNRKTAADGCRHV